MDKYIRIVLGGIASTIVMISVSSFIHGFVFHNTWDSVAFMRPVDSWPFMPGVPIATLIWNIIIAWFFTIIQNSIPKKGFLKGYIYGIYLCILFVFFVELWNYLQFEMPFMTVVAGVLTYIIAIPIGGGLISIITKDTSTKPAEN
jgi:hypothetical protein